MGAFRVGLTGGIGSGKSTIAALFRNLGVPVIDADQVATALVQPGMPAVEEIARRFGGQIVKDGSLDRPALRARIFEDPAERRTLESILHPLVYLEMDAQARAVDYPYCILSVPLLLETAPKAFVDRIVVVDCSVDAQIRRTRARDRSSDHEVRRIIASQISRQARVAMADDVIANNGTLEGLSSQVELLHRKCLELAASSSHCHCPATDRSEIDT